MSEKIKILYIDDESDNLIGFKASFRTNYRILIAENTTRAIEIMEKEPDIRVVFCDQRMPGKTGSAFFEEITVRFPLPIRILITGYADMDAVIDAINKGHIFRFVQKPWKDADIISAIEEANKFYMANSMLQTRNLELQEAYTELDKFAYSVSHDLRSPLAGILVGINSAFETSSMEEIKELLLLMEKSAFKLDNYICNMHEYYRSRRGVLKITEIDFKQLAEEISSVYKVYTNANKISFEINVNQVGAFYTDELMMKMILNNLITNAVKYQKKNSNDKRIKLDISVENGIVEISITDTGIGIAENDFHAVFNSFSEETSPHSGSGLGLYNIKSALLKLDGSIEVSSVVGSGSVFKLRIPNKQ